MYTRENTPLTTYTPTIGPITNVIPNVEKGEKKRKKRVQSGGKRKRCMDEDADADFGERKKVKGF